MCTYDSRKNDTYAHICTSHFPVHSNVHYPARASCDVLTSVTVKISICIDHKLFCSVTSIFFARIKNSIEHNSG